MRTLGCYPSLALAMVGLSATPQVASCASPTVLEVKLSVDLPPRHKKAIGQTEVTAWELAQAGKLAETLQKSEQASYFPFWSFAPPKAIPGKAAPGLRVRVAPGEDTTTPKMVFSVFFENPPSQPLTIHKGVLFQDRAYEDFEGKGVQYGLDAIVAKLKQVLLADERDQFRARLMERVWIADGIDPLPAGQAGPGGVLPFRFKDWVADCHRSHFQIVCKLNGMFEFYKGFGDGRIGTPAQLRVKYEAQINARSVAVAVKVTRIVSDSEEGLPGGLDPLP